MKMWNMKISDFKWNTILNHPLEVFRIDEQLKNKERELTTLISQNPTMKYELKREIIKHKRLIYNMRSHLNIFCIDFFGQPMLNFDELINLQNGFTAEDFMEIMRSNEPNSNHMLSKITSLNTPDFWTFLNYTADRRNTEKLYIKILSTLSGKNYELDVRDGEVLQNIISNVNY